MTRKRNAGTSKGSDAGRMGCFLKCATEATQLAADLFPALRPDDVHDKMLDMLSGRPADTLEAKISEVVLIQSSTEPVMFELFVLPSSLRGSTRGSIVPLDLEEQPKEPPHRTQGMFPCWVLYGKPSGADDKALFRGMDLRKSMDAYVSDLFSR